MAALLRAVRAACVVCAALLALAPRCATCWRARRRFGPTGRFARISGARFLPVQGPCWPCKHALLDSETLPKPSSWRVAQDRGRPADKQRGQRARRTSSPLVILLSGFLLSAAARTSTMLRRMA